MMLNGAKIPLYQNNDLDALRTAIRTSPRADLQRPRIARIHDTLSLSEIEISQALLPDVLDRSDVEILSEPYELQFDPDGFLEDL